MAVIKLTGGKTVADFTSFIQQNPDSPLPEWILGYGGPGQVEPGATAYFATDIIQGTYFAYDTLINAETGESMILKYVIHQFQAIAPRK